MLRASYRAARRGLQRMRKSYRALRTMALRAAGRNDISRWADIDTYDVGWNERTYMLAAWIPEGSRVLEFGAGRQALKDRLPPNCTYFPSDLVKRTDDTLVHDLNQRPFAPMPACDVMVLSGVLEYVADLDEVVAHLAKHCSRIVTSYAAIELTHNTNVVDRRAAGWINDYSVETLQALFHRHGFTTTETKRWGNQVLFCFELPAAGAAAVAS